MQSQMMFNQQSSIQPQVPPRTGQMTNLQSSTTTGAFNNLKSPNQPIKTPENDPFNDIFSSIQSSKPSQNEASGIDSYLMQSKGVLPVNNSNETPPKPSPRTPNNQSFGASLFG